MIFYAPFKIRDFLGEIYNSDKEIAIKCKMYTQPVMELMLYNFFICSAEFGDMWTPFFLLGDRVDRWEDWKNKECESVTSHLIALRIKIFSKFQIFLPKILSH